MNQLIKFVIYSYFYILFLFIKKIQSLDNITNIDNYDNNNNNSLCTSSPNSDIINNNVDIKCPDFCTNCTIIGMMTICTECEKGYFLSNSQCMPCPTSLSNCLDCEKVDSKISCLECATDYYLNQDNTSCITCSELHTNCISCTSSGECIECDSNYFLKNSECLTCNEFNPHCTNCSSTGSCLECETDYFLEDSKCLTCEDLTPNCKTCDANGTCIECKDTFIHYQSQCLTCEQLHANCSSCNDKGECVECKKGTFLRYLACRTCQEHFMNCITCAQNGLNATCTECKGGYILSASGTCQICQELYPNCAYCLNTGNSTICQQCNSGYYLNNGSCYLCSTNITNCLYCAMIANISTVACNTCASGFFVTDEYKCEMCNRTLENCVSCLNAETCLECNAGYFLENNTCVQCPQDKNCKDCLNNETCKECDKGYYLMGSDCYQCEGLFEGCPNCDVGSSDPLCRTCQELYDQFGKCSLCKTVVGNIKVCDKCTVDSYFSLNYKCIEICKTDTYSINETICVDSCDEKTYFHKKSNLNALCSCIERFVNMNYYSQAYNDIDTKVQYYLNFSEEEYIEKSDYIFDILDKVESISGNLTESYFINISLVLQLISSFNDQYYDQSFKKDFKAIFKDIRQSLSNIIKEYYNNLFTGGDSDGFIHNFILQILDNFKYFFSILNFLNENDYINLKKSYNYLLEYCANSSLNNDTITTAINQVNEILLEVYNDNNLVTNFTGINPYIINNENVTLLMELIDKQINLVQNYNEEKDVNYSYIAYENNKYNFISFNYDKLGNYLVCYTKNELNYALVLLPNLRAFTVSDIISRFSRYVQQKLNLVLFPVDISNYPTKSKTPHYVNILTFKNCTYPLYNRSMNEYIYDTFYRVEIKDENGNQYFNKLPQPIIYVLLKSNNEFKQCLYVKKDKKKNMYVLSDEGCDVYTMTFHIICRCYYPYDFVVGNINVREIYQTQKFNDRRFINSFDQFKIIKKNYYCLVLICLFLLIYFMLLCFTCLYDNQKNESFIYEYPDLSNDERLYQIEKKFSNKYKVHLIDTIKKSSKNLLRNSEFVNNNLYISQVNSNDQLSKTVIGSQNSHKISSSNINRKSVRNSLAFKSLQRNSNMLDKKKEIELADLSKRNNGNSNINFSNLIIELANSVNSSNTNNSNNNNSNNNNNINSNKELRSTLVGKRSSKDAHLDKPSKNQNKTNDFLTTVDDIINETNEEKEEDKYDIDYSSNQNNNNNSSQPTFKVIFINIYQLLFFNEYRLFHIFNYNKRVVITRSNILFLTLFRFIFQLSFLAFVSKSRKKGEKIKIKYDFLNAFYALITIDVQYRIFKVLMHKCKVCSRNLDVLQFNFLKVKKITTYFIVYVISCILGIFCIINTLWVTLYMRENKRIFDLIIDFIICICYDYIFYENIIILLKAFMISFMIYNDKNVDTYDKISVNKEKKKKSKEYISLDKNSSETKNLSTIIFGLKYIFTFYELEPI